MLFRTSPPAPLPGTNAHLLVAPDGATVLRLPSGRFLRAEQAPVDLLDVLAGGGHATPEVSQYIHALRDDVVALEHADTRRRWPTPGRPVGVIGRGTVIDDVSEVMLGWGLDVRRHTTADQLLRARGAGARDVGDLELVVAYADSPRDRAGWERLDELPQTGCAWLRAHREGQVCFVDPLSMDGEDPGSDQVLRRRRAASPTPGPFAAWHAAARGEPLDPSARVLLTARVLTVALAWAQGGTRVDPLRRTLWKYVPATGQVSEHSVLGYDPPYVPPVAGGTR